jgi:hypothetical protein
MRNIFIRILSLILQVILITIAVHVAEKLVACLIDASTRRSKRLPQIGLLFACEDFPSLHSRESETDPRI